MMRLLRYLLSFYQEVVLLLITIAFIPITFAATIHVNTINDELNNDGDCSLREAIQSANKDISIDACVSGNEADEIVFTSSGEAQVFKLEIQGSDEDQAASGDLDITDDLTITGNGARQTIIDGNRIDRVLQLINPINVFLNSLTIRRGDRPNGSSSRSGGGILTSFDSGLTINNSLIVDNAAPSGGGIKNQQGQLTIINSTIANNSSHLGGGIFNNGGTMTIESSTFSGNRATRGAGIYEDGFGTRITNTSIINNIGKGGICFDSSKTTITNSTIADNLGGNICHTSGGVATLQNTIVGKQTENCATHFATLITSLGNNLFGEPFCDINKLSSDLSGDPRLGSLPNLRLGINPDFVLSPAGGHLPLLPDSPAIDAANNAACLPNDQLGRTRVDGNNDGNVDCDIGAIEFFPLAEKIEFQNDVLPVVSYNGTIDAYISEAEPSRTFNVKKLLIDGNNGGGNDFSSLIRWDLSTFVPPRSRLKSASITLDIFDSSNNGYNIYALKRSWTESAVSWELQRNAKAAIWEILGAKGSKDRDSNSLGSVFASDTGLLTIPLNNHGALAVIQRWIDNPDSNHGVIIADEHSENGVDFYSSEFHKRSSRPKLSLHFDTSHRPRGGATEEQVNALESVLRDKCGITDFKENFDPVTGALGKDTPSPRLFNIGCANSNLTDDDLEYFQIIKSIVRPSGLHVGSVATIDLSHNQLTHVDGLRHLTFSKIVNLSHNKLRNVDGLHNLTTLKHLDLSHNELTNVDGLSNLEFAGGFGFDDAVFGGFFLNDNKLVNVDGLKRLKSGAQLNIANNLLVNVDGLHSLNNVGVLHLENNSLSNIKGLRNLKIIGGIDGNSPKKRIGGIYLQNNLLRHLNGLRGLRRVVGTLDFSHNLLTNIKGLRHITSLRTKCASAGCFGALSLKHNLLDNLKGLPAVSLAAYPLIISSNPALRDLSHLSAITEVKPCSMSESNTRMPAITIDGIDYLSCTGIYIDNHQYIRKAETQTAFCRANTAFLAAQNQSSNSDVPTLIRIDNATQEKSQVTRVCADH
jgi:CSLREA domain-containing protein